MKTNIILGKYIPNDITGEIIACDVAVYHLLINGYTDFIAIGDYDSCTKDEYDFILSNKDKLKDYDECSSIKNETDLELAINIALNNEKLNEINIYSNFKNIRLDHIYANINVMKYVFKIGIGINYYLNNNNLIYLLDPGEQLVKRKQFKYISFFALIEVSDLSLINFRYELTNHYLTTTSALCVSNEFASDEATVKFSNGMLLAIESND